MEKLVTVLNLHVCILQKKQEYISVLFIKFVSLPRFPRRCFRKEAMGGGKYTYIEKTFT